MPIPENFKYDMRVRERMLKRGILTEAELTKHVDGLVDVADQVVEVELKQPALMKESERETRVVTRASMRPPAAAPSFPVRSIDDELNDIDDDDDDDIDDEDEDDEEEVKAKADKAAAAAAAPAPAPAAEPAPEPAAAPEEEKSEAKADDEGLDK